MGGSRCRDLDPAEGGFDYSSLLNPLPDCELSSLSLPRSANEC